MSEQALQEQIQEAKTELVEELKTLTPEEVEKRLLQQEADTFANQDPTDAALTLFGLYQPMFSGLVNKLSTNGLRRVMKALVAKPLAEDKIRFPNETEEKAFAIGTRVLEAKFVAIMNNYNKHMKLAEEQKKNEETKQEEVQTTQTETKN